jgi:spore maturation protein CgeB
MRAERLRVITPGWRWDWVDTDAPMRSSARLWRTLAFRTKRGKAVERINAAVGNAAGSERYDLAWVDKGVFLNVRTMGRLRSLAKRTVHFTPDTAFHANRSRHFEAAMDHYDLLVTTKSFELGDYERHGAGGRLMLTTQGYDATLHRPAEDASPRRREVVFVGLAEPDRERCLGLLLDRGIPVRLGGRGWGRFRRRYRGCPHLAFEGEDVFGEDYASVLRGSWIGVGMLSKRFPELHTTRTFEIPACGTILATEENSETSSYFRPDEVLFFNDYESLAGSAIDLFCQPEESLSQMAQAGRARVSSDGRDYDSILTNILDDPRLRL